MTTLSGESGREGSTCLARLPEPTERGGERDHTGERKGGGVGVPQARGVRVGVKSASRNDGLPASPAVTKKTPYHLSALLVKVLAETLLQWARAVPTIGAKGSNAVSGDLAARLSCTYSVQKVGTALGRYYSFTDDDRQFEW